LESGFSVEIGRVIFAGESEALHSGFDGNGEDCQVLNLLLAEICVFIKMQNQFIHRLHYPSP